MGSATGASLLQALEGPLARAPFCTQDEAGSLAEVAVGAASHYLCPNPVFQGLRGVSLNSAFSSAQGENTMLPKCHRSDPCMSW